MCGAPRAPRTPVRTAVRRSRESAWIRCARHAGRAGMHLAKRRQHGGRSMTTTKTTTTSKVSGRAVTFALMAVLAASGCGALRAGMARQRYINAQTQEHVYHKPIAQVW